MNFERASPCCMPAAALGSSRGPLLVKIRRIRSASSADRNRRRSRAIGVPAARTPSAQAQISGHGGSLISNNYRSEIRHNAYAGSLALRGMVSHREKEKSNDAPRPSGARSRRADRQTHALSPPSRVHRDDSRPSLSLLPVTIELASVPGLGLHFRRVSRNINDASPRVGTRILSCVARDFARDFRDLDAFS